MWVLYCRLLFLSVRFSAISQTMPSCGPPRDVIKAFLRPRVDYGEYSRHLLLGRGSNTLMAVRACYVAVPLYVCGFLALGTAFQKHDSVFALIMGWGIAQVAIMVNTVAVCASHMFVLFVKVQGLSPKMPTPTTVSRNTREKLARC